MKYVLQLRDLKERYVPDSKIWIKERSQLVSSPKIFDHTVKTEVLRNLFVVYCAIFPKRVPKVQIDIPTYCWSH